MTFEKINGGGRISSTSRRLRVVDCAGAEWRTGAQQFRCNYDMKNPKGSHHMNPFFYLNWTVSEMRSFVCQWFLGENQLWLEKNTIKKGLAECSLVIEYNCVHLLTQPK